MSGWDQDYDVRTTNAHLAGYRLVAAHCTAEARCGSAPSWVLVDADGKIFGPFCLRHARRVMQGTIETTCSEATTRPT